MTQLLMLTLAAFATFQEPAKSRPGEKWYSLLEGEEFRENSLKLIAIAPEAAGDFEAIVNDPNVESIYVSRLYYVLGKSKVDHKRFLKLALRDLNHAEERVRCSAATFAGNVGGGPEFAAPLLMLMLHDPDTSVTNAARRALGQVGDAGTVVALEHLIRFGTGKPETPKRAKELTAAFTETRDEIKARLAAAKPTPAPPK